MALYQATIDDKPYIMALYTEAIGSEGCTWNEDYPSEETMDSDLARGDAYVWKDETGELLGESLSTMIMSWKNCLAGLRNYSPLQSSPDWSYVRMPEDRRLPEK